jgi:hypothetical protein
MAKRVNSGKTTFTRSTELATVKLHLSNVKRVDSRNDQGEQLSSWVATGEDHYAHSLNYAHIAMDMLLEGSSTGAIPALPMMKKRAMRSEPKETAEVADPLGLRFAQR